MLAFPTLNLRLHSLKPNLYSFHPAIFDLISRSALNSNSILANFRLQNTHVRGRWATVAPEEMGTLFGGCVLYHILHGVERLRSGASGRGYPGESIVLFHTSLVFSFAGLCRSFVLPTYLAYGYLCSIPPRISSCTSHFLLLCFRCFLTSSSYSFDCGVSLFSTSTS